MVSHHKEAIKTGKTVIGEEQVKTDKIARKKYVTAYISPLYDEKKKLIGTIGISVDVTTEKMFKEIASEEKTLWKSVKSVKKVEAFLKNPLLAIKTGSDQIKRLLSNDTNEDTAIDSKQRQSIRLAEKISHKVDVINNDMKGTMFDLNQNLKELDDMEKNSQ